MNCDDALPLLYDLVDGELSEADRGQLEPHLKSCEHCRQLLPKLQAAEQIYRQELIVPPAAELAPRLIDALETEHRLALPQWNVNTRWLVARVALAAAAMAALAYFGSLLLGLNLVSEQVTNPTTSLNPQQWSQRWNINWTDLFQTLSNLQLLTTLQGWLATVIGAANDLNSALPINLTTIIALVSVQIIVSYRLLKGGGPLPENKNS